MLVNPARYSAFERDEQMGFLVDILSSGGDAGI